MDELELAISAGDCVLIEDIDDYIDLSLKDLLEKNFICKYVPSAIPISVRVTNVVCQCNEVMTNRKDQRSCAAKLLHIYFSFFFS